MICFLLALPVELDNTNVERELQTHGVEASHAVLAMRFAACNLVTLGHGTVLPLDHVGFMLAYVQMFAGVLLNVLILTGACNLITLSGTVLGHTRAESAIARPRDPLRH
jgi:putative Mn2+ efflux pump MntP